MSEVSFVWLEITGKCQLQCVHCYAESGPGGSHGVMETGDWIRVIDEVAGLGVSMVQFIGGEPTLHPALPVLLEHALRVGVEVEVFSNLVHVTPALWELFALPGVRLACSYYSDDAGQHAAVTGRGNSYARTKANIAEAVRRSVPLRVGVVDLADDQRSRQATDELTGLGVTDIGWDQLRGVGRGQRDHQGGTPGSVDQLCGQCASNVLAVSPTGEVWPCVFSRWLPSGNVRTSSLGEIVAGPVLRDIRAGLVAEFEKRSAQPCVPNMCDPQCGPSCGPACNPSCWPHGTGPCTPRGGCVPHYR
ncbi:radical SAM protein [Kribbella sp. NPDC051587]|uniref:radical SAM protein n=1 Tax=Kribbella sp. NPDC051587 TaxID=3364119 RepID=UPI0037AD7066